jgi:predicted MFS family arabinose efflux permease
MTEPNSRPQPGNVGPGERARARRNLVLAFLAQNCALGITYGTYGTFLRPIEAQYGVSRAVASIGMSVLLLVLGVLSPFVGTLLKKVSIRLVMIAGALLNVFANLVLAHAPGIGELLVGYAVLGAGTCLLGIIAPTTLVSRWYEDGRGRALGVMNLPLMLPLAPLAMAEILPAFGLRGGFLVVAAINLALAPLLLLVRDDPGAGRKDPEAGGEASDAAPLGPVFASRAFWLLTLGNGILTGAGTAFVVHFIAYAGTRGLPLDRAAVILTGYGVSGLAGTLAFGWLADRITPARALCLNAMLSAALWAMLLLVARFEPMLVAACLIGCCTTALVALQGAVTASVFGVRYISSVMGITYFFKLPFIFGAAPLVGLLFDETGSYTLGFCVVIAGFVCAALAFAFVRPRSAPATGGA